jgi:hypothetical protein
VVWTESLHAVLNGEPTALDLSGDRYVAIDECFDEGRAVVEKTLGADGASGAFFDTTTLYTVDRLMRQDNSYLTPTTLVDLANFVSAVVLFDRVFYLETAAIDSDALNAALGSDVIVPLPLSRFSAGLRMEAGILADTWQASGNHCSQLLRATKQSNAHYDERCAVERAWTVLLGRDLTIDDLLDEWYVDKSYDSDGPELILRMLDTGRSIGGSSQAFQHIAGQLRIRDLDQWATGAGMPADVSHVVTECNYRACFNSHVGYYLNLRYVANSFRLPFQRFLFDRAYSADADLATLHLIEQEYARQVANLRLASTSGLVVPFFLAAILADLQRVEDFGAVLGAVRRQAAALRRRRRELDEAIAGDNPQVVKKVLASLRVEAKKLNAGVAKSASASTAAVAVSALSGAAAPVLLAAIFVVAFAGSFAPEAVSRIVRRATRPEWWMLANQARVATSMLNAYPRVAELWGVPAQSQRDFSVQFASLSRL